MSGSIACYKVCALISKLVQNNFNVKVVMSASAQKFVGTATIEGLSQNAVHTDTFETGQAMEHIHLARWADLILLAPATANTINKMSQGVGDDLISTLFLAHDFSKPFLLAPAMNTKMYLHPTTQKSITELRAMGVEILEAASGVLACGEVGYGRLLEPDLIYSEIVSRLNISAQPTIQHQPKAAKPALKILITSGGTQEPIDDIRFISNSSSGKTAATLADQFINAGYDVTYLCAQSAALPQLHCEVQKFKTYRDLDQALEKQLLKSFDVVVHAAAVSDYSVGVPFKGKINSSSEKLQINLVKNPKLIDKIKQLSPKSLLVGFKLTSQAPPEEITEKVKNLFKQAQCDYVVHNDWSQVHTDNHTFNLYSKNTKQDDLTLLDLSYTLTDAFLKRNLL